MNEQDLIREHLADGWQVYADDGFIGLAGPFFHRSGPGGPAFRLATLPKHHNRNGVLQGGALMTFIDRAMGATARELTQTPHTATVQINVNFIDAVRIGEAVQAAPQMVRATRQLIFMSGTFAVDERVVAVATGVWKKIVHAGGRTL